MKQWAMFVLGVWMAGTILVAVAAAQNFYTVDRLLAGSANATFRSVTDGLGLAPSRDLLRYLASELNRLYFRLWAATQFVLGIVILGLIGRPTTPARIRWALVAMLAIVAVMSVGLVPPIVSVGRSLDFVPRDPPPPALRTFGLLHTAYVGLDGVKVVLGALVAVWIHRSDEEDGEG
jgi:hypothetical protein